MYKVVEITNKFNDYKGFEIGGTLPVIILIVGMLYLITRSK